MNRNRMSAFFAEWATEVARYCCGEQVCMQGWECDGANAGAFGVGCCQGHCYMRRHSADRGEFCR